jgi:uncharacterized protein (DUF2384 family)
MGTPVKAVLEAGESNDSVTSSAAVARLVPVIARAVAVFGDEHKATHWLSTASGVFRHSITRRAAGDQRR